MSYRERPKRPIYQRIAKKRNAKAPHFAVPRRGPTTPSHRPSRTPQYLPALERVSRERSEFRRKILLAGYVSRWLREDGIDAFVVGGQAVDIYTGGQFATADIDIVVSDTGKATNLLRSLGFTPEGRVWLNERLGIVVDVLSGPLTGSVERVRVFRVGDVQIRLPAVEDLIVERLVSAKYWKGAAQNDLEKASALLTIFKDKLDDEYLGRRAEEQRVEDYLEKLRNTEVQK